MVHSLGLHPLRDFRDSAWTTPHASADRFSLAIPLQMLLNPPPFISSGVSSLARSSAAILGHRVLEEGDARFWPPLPVPTFPRLVCNGCLVLIVLRLGHHHGGQWGHKVVLEGQLQRLGCEVLLLLPEGILAMRRNSSESQPRT